LEKLVEGIYYFANLMSSQYLIEDENGLTLIDTGVAGHARAILAGISNLGYNRHDLKHILITHADCDHYGSLHRLQKQTEAVTLTSDLEGQAIQVGRMSRELKPRSNLERIQFRIFSPILSISPAAVDRIIAPGDELTIGSGMVVIDSCGHTPGHLSFYLPENRILFSGDSIFRKNGKFIPSYGINCWDEAKAIKALEVQLALTPKIICGGHSIFRLVT